MTQIPTLSDGSPDPRYAGYCECCWPDIDMELALEAEAKAYEEDWFGEKERLKLLQAGGSVPANGEPNAHGATVGASGASGEPETGVPMTPDEVIDAERRPGEPRWRAAARLLERLYPEEFAPPAGAHIDVQGEYVAEEYGQ